MTDRVFYSVPAKSLKFATRYLVVIHNLTASDGTLFPPAPLTAEYVNAYLYGDTKDVSGDERFLRLSEPTNGAFALLDQLGVDLTKIQLIW